MSRSFVKVPLSRELQRMMRSRVKERRPQCPVCLQYAPGPDEPRDDWTEPFGHRDPAGEPCPGFQGGLKATPGQPPLRVQTQALPDYEPIAFCKGKRRKPTSQLALFDIVEGAWKLWNSTIARAARVVTGANERSGNSQVRTSRRTGTNLEKTG